MSQDNQGPLQAIAQTLDHWLAAGLLEVDEKTRCLEDSRDRLAAAQSLPPAKPPQEVVQAGLVEQWRGLRLISEELRRWAAAEKLSPASVFRCQNALAASFKTLQREVGAPAAPTPPPPVMAPPVKAPSADIVLAEVQESAAPPRSFLDMLLDPQTIRILLISSAGLLTLGLAGWLWSVGVFDHPLVAATILGAINLAVLGAGFFLVQSTRYQTAGRAVTLLACLVMPLNLWFYDAQGLVSLDDGGHLWIPALGCCIIYAVIVRWLKDEWFVYTFVAGMTLTGVLFLADAWVARFWEITAPATLLIVWGTVCLHCELFFETGDGPFSRGRFGRAFFRAGHIVLGCGLLLLLGGQLTSIYYDSLFSESWRPFSAPEIARLTHLKWVACGLTVLAAYAHGYSRWILGRSFFHAVLSIACMLWSGWIVLDILGVQLTATLAILVLAISATAGYLLVALGMVGSFHDRKELGAEAEKVSSLPALVLGLAQTANALAVAWSVGLLLAVFTPTSILGDYPLSWLYVLATAATTVACGVGSWAHHRRSEAASVIAWTYGFTLMRLITVFSALYLLQVQSWEAILPLLIAVPLALSLAASRTNDIFWRNALKECCLAEGALLLLASLWPAVQSSAVTISGWPWAPMGLALFFMEAGVLFAVGGPKNRHGNVALMTVSFCGAMWQVLLIVGVASYTPWIALASAGLIIIMVQRFTKSGVGAAASDPQADSAAAFALAGSPAGHLCVTISLVASVLMAVNQWFASSSTWAMLGLLVFQLATSSIAAMASSHSSWRQAHWVQSMFAVAASALLCYSMLRLDFLDVAELFTFVVGALLLTAGLQARLRDPRAENDSGIVELTLGSMLASGPMVVALLAHRFLGYGDGVAWVVAHEGGVLAVGLLLLCMGAGLRVKSTTLCGAGDFGRLCPEPGRLHPPARANGDRIGLHDDRRRRLLHDRGAAKRVSRSPAKPARKNATRRRRVPGPEVEVSRKSGVDSNCKLQISPTGTAPNQPWVQRSATPSASS